MATEEGHFFSFLRVFHHKNTGLTKRQLFPVWVCMNVFVLCIDCCRLSVGKPTVCSLRQANYQSFMKSFNIFQTVKMKPQPFLFILFHNGAQRQLKGIWPEEPGFWEARWQPRPFLGVWVGSPIQLVFMSLKPLLLSSMAISSFGTILIGGATSFHVTCFGPFLVGL